MSSRTKITVSLLYSGRPVLNNQIAGDMLGHILALRRLMRHDHETFGVALVASEYGMNTLAMGSITDVIIIESDLERRAQSLTSRALPHISTDCDYSAEIRPVYLRLFDRAFRLSYVATTDRCPQRYVSWSRNSNCFGSLISFQMI